jgi:diguanylate cyclase (GGDEF)-like protein
MSVLRNANRSDAGIVATGVANERSLNNGESSSSLLRNVACTTSCWDRDDLDVAICGVFLRHLNAHSITLLRLFEDGQITRLSRKVTVGRGQTGRELTSSVETANLPELADEAAWMECFTRNAVIHSQTNSGRTVTHLPMAGDRGIAGIVNIEAAASLPSNDRELVSDILLILRNHLALLDYGERDSLTGLLNRKTFESRFDKLRQRNSLAASSGTPAPNWLALIDIDHFKSVNDRHGHLFGDEVLLLVSRLMKRTFRGSDHVFRFGGEEFLIVLENIDGNGVRIALDRLRSAVEGYAFPQIGTVTISAGYTRVSSRDVSTTCVERADAALYYAKNNGRNCIHCTEMLLAEGKLTEKAQSESIEMF